MHCPPALHFFLSLPITIIANEMKLSFELTTKGMKRAKLGQFLVQNNYNSLVYK